MNIYYLNPYLAETQATITSIQTKAANTIIELDQSISYPGGGGQASDLGEIIGANGSLRFDHSCLKDAETVLHQGRMIGNLGVGENVSLRIKWSHRHHGMRLHSAGHAIHDILAMQFPKLNPIKGNHGGDPHLEYAGDLPGEYQAEIEAQANALVNADLPVVMKESNLEEIQANCRHVPPGLPVNKPLRVVQIGVGQLIPCGGIHVKSLAEIGRIVISGIRPSNKTVGNIIVKYRVTKQND